MGWLDDGEYTLPLFRAAAGGRLHGGGARVAEYRGRDAEGAVLVRRLTPRGRLLDQVTRCERPGPDAPEGVGAEPAFPGWPRLYRTAGSAAAAWAAGEGR